MANFDPRQETMDAVIRRIGDLSEQSLIQLSQYISYLKWQEELWQSLLETEEIESGSGQQLVWKYDFLESFPKARQASTRRPDLMEIKVGMAACGMVQQQAIWQHPPVSGSAVLEYQLHVPSHVDRLSMQFAVGIRDGSLLDGDNFCAFRIFVNGLRLWSTTKQAPQWERYLIDLPNLAGKDVVIQFMTDGLGDARWNWAVWAEPQLLGYTNE
jgi:hypothetical protein